MKKIICKLLGKHNYFIPGTKLGDIIEIGKQDHGYWSKETKFRCRNCGELV